MALTDGSLPLARLSRFTRRALLTVSRVPGLGEVMPVQVTALPCGLMLKIAVLPSGVMLSKVAVQQPFAVIDACSTMSAGAGTHNGSHMASPVPPSSVMRAVKPVVTLV